MSSTAATARRSRRRARAARPPSTRSAGSSSSTPSTEGRAVEERRAAPHATLVYDHKCGSCAKFAAVVRALDTDRRIDIVSMHDKGVEERLRPRLGEAYDRSFHLVIEAEDRVV